MMSSVGKQVAANAVSDLTEPLISHTASSISSNAIDDSGETATAKAEYPLLLTVAHGLLVLGGMATSVVAMVTAPAISVYVACLVCMVNSPLVAVKQRTIIKSGGVREAIKLCRVGVGLLQDEADILASVIDDLQGEANSLSDIGQKLDDIVRGQGSNSNEFISLLKENESNLKGMKDNLRAIAVADIAAIFLKADKDGNMTIDSREINELTLRVKTKLSSQGIDIDEDQFKAMVHTNNDVSHLLKVVEEILFAETVYGAGTTEYTREALQEEEEDGVVGGLVAVGAIAKLKRIGSLAEGDDEDAKQDAPPMFSLQEKNVGGRVRRESLSKKPRDLSQSHCAKAKAIMKQTSSAQQKVEGFFKNSEKSGQKRMKLKKSAANTKKQIKKVTGILRGGPN